MRSFVYFFRNMIARKSVAIFSVLSLSIGITISLLIGLSVWEEYNFDRFHQDGKDIYRIVSRQPGVAYPSVFRKLGDKIETGLPEVKKICRIISETKLDFTVNGQFFPDNHQTMADPDFFTFFSFPLKYGDPLTCLQNPNDLVISEKLAERWFPGQNPVGQMVEGDSLWKISAVMYDIPYHSHIQTDVVTSFMGRFRELDCGSDSFSTYLNIPDLKDKKFMEGKITGMYEGLIDWVKEAELKCELEALKDIHFSPVGSAHAGDKMLVRILITVAVVILLIACINFINLFTSASFIRSREIGVRKVMGAGRLGLIGGFYKETLWYVLLSVLVGIIIAVFCLPLFNSLTHYQLRIDFYAWRFYVYLIALVVVIVLIAGTFPAFYMTRYNISDTLGRKFRGNALAFLQRSLLVVQFVFSIVFLLSAFLVNRQLQYMINYDLGFDKENVICMRARGQMSGHYDVVRSELLRCPSITRVSIKDGLPMRGSSGYPLRKPGTNEVLEVTLYEVGANYFDFMGMKFVKGENPFSENSPATGVVVNETTAKLLGMTDSLKMFVNIMGTSREVKGVVKDVLVGGANQGREARIYFPLYAFGMDADYQIMCKVTGNPSVAIEALRKQWNNYTPEREFEYRFLDEVYAGLYKSERNMRNISGCGMVVMLLISSMGLFAMVFYTAQRRTKEVGIRKVNGATVRNLILLLNTDFLKWVLVAYVIACPLTVWFMSRWLENFIYPTEMSLWVFLLAGIISLGVAFITVCFLTWKVAHSNPVDSLRNE